MDYDKQLDRSAALRIEYLSRKPYRDVQKLFSKEDIHGLTCKSLVFTYILSTNNKRYRKLLYYERPEFEQTKALLKKHLLDDLRQDALYTLNIIESIKPQLIWY